MKHDTDVSPLALIQCVAETWHKLGREFSLSDLQRLRNALAEKALTALPEAPIITSSVVSHDGEQLMKKIRSAGIMPLQRLTRTRPNNRT